MRRFVGLLGWNGEEHCEGKNGEGEKEKAREKENKRERNTADTMSGLFVRHVIF
jgi:hypothetical protein